MHVCPSYDILMMSSLIVCWCGSWLGADVIVDRVLMWHLEMCAHFLFYFKNCMCKMPIVLPNLTKLQKYWQKRRILPKFQQKMQQIHYFFTFIHYQTYKKSVTKEGLHILTAKHVKKKIHEISKIIWPDLQVIFCRRRPEWKPVSKGRESTAKDKYMASQAH